MSVLDEIRTRREHQIQKGYDAAHDDEHRDGSIGCAAASYLCRSLSRSRDMICNVYPWGEMPHEGSGRDDLIDAAALIVAEIERMDRMKGDTK